MNKKMCRIYENLARMSYDCVKVPLAICLLQPLFLDRVPGEILFFGAVTCLLFIYFAVLLDLKSQEGER